MKEELINFETAKLAKEKNYTSDCYDFFIRGEIEYKRPTQGLLQKWLREKHDINITVARVALGSDEMEYCYSVIHLPKEFEDAKRWVSLLERIDSFSSYGSTYSGAWRTYEEALEQALQESLKLIP
jgi:hypothetical protein